MLVSPLGSAQSPDRNLQLAASLQPTDEGGPSPQGPGTPLAGPGDLCAPWSPLRRVSARGEGSDAAPVAPAVAQPQGGHWDRVIVQGGNSIHAWWDLGSCESGCHGKAVSGMIFRFFPVFG